MTAVPTQRIGFVGVGLMGHGMAKCILERGRFALTIRGHRNRAPIDDLVARGAKEAASIADLAACSDIVVLSLPSSVEVAAVAFGPDGLVESLRPGSVVVDTSTADPRMIHQLAAALAPRGCHAVDASVGRTPREAEIGALSTYVGGEADVIDRLRPVLASYADTIIPCGPLGSAITCKLINNSVNIGMAALISEAFATAARLHVDPTVLSNVLSAGAVQGRMWSIMREWIVNGDPSHLQATLRTAAKDVRTYVELAAGADLATPIARSVGATLARAGEGGQDERYLSTLPGILAELDGDFLRECR